MSADINPGLSSVYRGVRGKSLARPVNDCESQWNREFPVGNLDNLLLHQLQLAKKEGRSVVDVVDLGSGVGNLFASYRPSESTGKFLEDHGMTVRMIGLTAQEGSAMPMDKTTLSTAHSGIRAENIAYSVTTAHQLKDLLVAENLQPNLIFATHFLTYLHPDLFASTVDQAVQSLAPGGKFIAFDFDTYAGSKLSADPELPYQRYPDRFMDLVERADRVVLSPDEGRRPSRESMLELAVEIRQELLFLRDTYLFPDSRTRDNMDFNRYDFFDFDPTVGSAGYQLSALLKWQVPEVRKAMDETILLEPVSSRKRDALRGLQQQYQTQELAKLVFGRNSIHVEKT